MESFLLTALTMGLLGGVHCAAMCGGIVGALSLRTGRSGAGVQVSYNAGRLLSYTAAGAVAGGMGSMGSLAGGLLPAQMLLFVVANAFVVLLGLHIAGWGRLVLRVESMGAAVWRRLQPALGRVLQADTPAKAVRLGLVWGWIPCGMVYSALVLALVSGSAARGAGIMLAFGAGTLPNLLAAGLLAQRVRPALRLGWVRSAAGTAIAVLGVVGLVRVPGIFDAVRAGILCLA